MDQVNQTLYIPLYGKDYVSRRGIILSDPCAERIWKEEGFRLHGKAASKWLAFYMGMRAAVFDRWTELQLQRHPDAVVLHLGCGMDSRAQRVSGSCAGWYDVDFPAVISERRRYFRDTELYHQYPADLRRPDWCAALPKGTAIVVMEGVSMYLQPEELRRMLTQITGHFSKTVLLMDCYTTMAAKASKFANPINSVGVHQVWGMDDPKSVTGETGLAFVESHSMTPEELISQLKPMEQKIFRKLYAGGFSQKLYRLYEYQSRS